MQSIKRIMRIKFLLVTIFLFLMPLRHVHGIDLDTQQRALNIRLLSGSGVMGSGLVVNRLREAESLRIGPDRDVDPLVALVAEESESHGRPDQVDEPARRGKVL